MCMSPIRIIKKLLKQIGMKNSKHHNIYYKTYDKQYWRDFSRLWHRLLTFLEYHRARHENEVILPTSASHKLIYWLSKKDLREKQPK